MINNYVPKLTELDKELIMAKVDKNVHVYVDRETCLNTIERHWARAKSKGLCELLGGNLIIKKEIEVIKSKEQLAKDIREASFDLIREIHELIDMTYYFDMNYDTRFFLRALISSENIAENRVHDNFEWKFKDNKAVKFSKGQKLTKAIKQVCEVFNIDLELFEEFRIKQSQILNDKKLKGTLCLSIHPLDYMTMSDNAHDWDSCMSWDNDGCYRTGTLECMNCEQTLIAYIESDNKRYDLGGGRDWNSKKWRQLVMFNDQAIMTNKGYPYHNDELSKIVLNWVAELAGEDYEGENIYYDDYSSGDIEGFEYIHVRTGDAMYDDTDNDSRSYVRLSKNYSPIVNVNIGYATAYCLCCGDTMDTDEDIICYDCRGDFYCESCNEICDNDDKIVLTNGETVCSYCYDHYYTTCENCREDINVEYGETQYLEDEDLQKYKDYENLCEGRYCQHCIDNMELKTDDLLNIKPVEEC